MQSNNGSQDSLLRSVKLQIDQTKFKGKVNDDAINAILQAIATQQENQGKYQLELASKNNDAIVNKIKDALEKLYDAQQNADSSSSASDKDNNNLVDDIVAELKKELAKLLPTKDDTSESKDTTTTDFKKLQYTIDNIKSTLDKSSDKTTTNEDKKQSTKETSAIEVPQSIVANVDFTTQFEQLQNYIDSTFKQLNDSLQPITSVNDMIQQSIIEMSSKISDIGKASFNAVAQPVALTLNKLENFTKDLTISLVNEVSSIKNALATVANDIVNNVSSKISGVFTSVVSLGKNILGKVTAPFKGLSDKLKGISASLKDSFKNVIGTVGGALKSMALAPLKLVGGLVSSFNPFKKKKKKPTKDEIKLSKMIDKVNDFIDNFFDNMLGYVEKFIDKALKFAKKVVNVLMTHIFAWLLVNVALIGLIFGLILKLISKPLMEILQPIMDFVDDIFTKLITFLTPVRDFLLTVLKETWNIIKAPFEGLMKGIGTVAEALGTALGKLIIGIADFMVDTLLPFLRDHLLPIFGAILDIIKLFFEAMKPWIEPLVNVVMAALVAIIPILQRLVMEVGEILIDIAKIIHAPIKFIADFFEGFNTNAKKIGEKVSEVVLTTLDIVLEGLKLIRDNLGNLFDLIKLYVIAPLNGLKTKLEAELVLLRDKLSKFYIPYVGLGEDISWRSPSSWFSFKKLYPFDGLKVTEEQVAKAKEISEKPVSELISDEMSKMQANIEADKAAKEATDLAKQLQQKQIENLLANQHKIDDILAIAINNNEHLVEIGKHFGVEIEPPKIEVAPPNVDVSVPEIDVDELNASSNDTASRIDKLIGIVQPLPEYMKMCMNAIQYNLDSILEKLDDKPNLLPIPLMENSANAAMMENM